MSWEKEVKELKSRIDLSKKMGGKEKLKDNMMLEELQ